MHRGGFLNIFLIMAAITLLLDVYVFFGLRTFVKDWQSIQLRRVVLWGYLLISVGVTVLFLLGVNSYSTAKGMTPYHEWMLSLLLVFFITKLIFVIVLLIGDLGRFFYGIGDRVISGKKKQVNPFSRHAASSLVRRRYW
jgi:hypothetical protein